MKVHVSSTFDYSENEFNEVLFLLNSVPGAINFVNGGSVEENVLQIISPDYISDSPLTFEGFWSLINNYRILNKIDGADYVTLLTPKRNRPNWFSAFQGKDIFVDTNDWDFYTKKESKYGVAFSVVENLLQTMMNLNINSLSTEPNIHRQTTGCINDLCQMKEDIMFKLRDCYICESCKNRIKKEKIAVPVILHLIHLMEYLRKQMVDNFSWLTEVEIDHVKVDSNGVLKIGDITVEMGEQNKSIYFLFLITPEGIPTQNLDVHRDILSRLYYTLKHPENQVTVPESVMEKERNVNRSMVQESKMKEVKGAVKLLVENKRFREEKSKINRKIKEALGLKMSELYMIHNLNENDLKVYKVNIEQDNIFIDGKFIL
nr:hypothetical protein [uncultured Chryseobacterium sp.]